MEKTQRCQENVRRAYRTGHALQNGPSQLVITETQGHREQHEGIDACMHMEVSLSTLSGLNRSPSVSCFFFFFFFFFAPPSPSPLSSCVASVSQSGRCAAPNVSYAHILWPLTILMTFPPSAIKQSCSGGGGRRENRSASARGL